MKTLFSIIALTLASLTVCACAFLGVRPGPALWRGLVVFVITYIGALAAALVVFMTYLSPEKPRAAAAPGPPVQESPPELSTENVEEQGSP